MSIENNPIVQTSKYKHGAVPFDAIKLEHFIPALDYAIEKANETFVAIKNNSDKPTFENTILAMEHGTELMGHVAQIYFNLRGAESNNEFKELAQEISPKLSAFGNKVHLDQILFNRIKVLYENRNTDTLSNEQKRLIEEQYSDFIQNGALLNDEDKEKVRNIDEQLSKLSPQFSQNTLNATNDFTYHTEDESELSGLPNMAKAQAAETAKSKGENTGWTFTLQAPSLFPVMQYADNRNLRETMIKATTKKAFGGKYDNQNIIKEMLALKYEKSQILGFKDHAEKILKKRMAANTETVMEFLNKLYSAYYPAAKKELEEIQKLAKEDGIETMQGWDLPYYQEKLKQQKFDFDQEALRPYFKAENVIDGIFKVAELMYGLEFQETTEVPVYHEGVRVFEVFDEDKSFLALFYVDLHPRETKGGGAWMTCWRSQGLTKAGKNERPLVSIVANLTPSTEETPSLLTFDEVNTIFHEFGHALHGMLSNVTYRSLSSPDVYWDFVELPSQIMENWLAEKETLQLFAKHYKTNEDIPEELIKKIKTSQSFHAGLAGLRQISLGFLDMAWYTRDPKDIHDIAAFEDKALEKTRLLPKVEGANISCSFGHIFAGGYSAGYYSYKWAEALDADAFEHFKEKGIFNKEVATSFRKNILEKGNTEPPMDIYVHFRGKKPDPDALLRRDNLL